MAAGVAADVLVSFGVVAACSVAVKSVSIGSVGMGVEAVVGSAAFLSVLCAQQISSIVIPTVLRRHSFCSPRLLPLCAFRCRTSFARLSPSCRGP